MAQHEHSGKRAFEQHQAVDLTTNIVFKSSLLRDLTILRNALVKICLQADHICTINPIDDIAKTFSVTSGTNPFESLNCTFPLIRTTFLELCGHGALNSGQAWPLLFNSQLYRCDTRPLGSTFPQIPCGMIGPSQFDLTPRQGDLVRKHRSDTNPDRGSPYELWTEPSQHTTQNLIVKIRLQTRAPLRLGPLNFSHFSDPTSRNTCPALPARIYD
ncbi:hypothetical protein EJ05DRAFT_497460 [Pseudovirgaria hyperparasitica]|uniref:Uncharacterized protein n=1 Tax=Pseudovirgaria hyperparasitica TaxID=470096 RepID=A0A6A6WDI1_9PEZI|nr:uncharacterized protein EJ05DRAFT_497460 [Pseudovirgaria hyperparasitica]KAF2760888.1 hypothetical protein EJ05DRAFT_497460 [Pseudovirgaria hyperparasitica]